MSFAIRITGSLSEKTLTMMQKQKVTLKEIENYINGKKPPKGKNRKTEKNLLI